MQLSVCRHSTQFLLWDHLSLASYEFIYRQIWIRLWIMQFANMFVFCFDCITSLSLNGRNIVFIYFLPFIAIIIIRARTTVDDFHFISFHWNRFVPSVFVFALRYIQLFSSHKLFQWIYQAWASACACYSIYFIAGLCHFPCFVDYIVCSFGCFCTMT